MYLHEVANNWIILRCSHQVQEITIPTQKSVLLTLSRDIEAENVYAENVSGLMPAYPVQ